jgi:uncharacterized membrane protein YkvA (DUF1232 family)
MPASRPTDPSLLSGVVPPPDRGGEGAPRIGATTLDATRVADFNSVLLRLCPRAAPLAAGQIAAAARRLLYTEARTHGSGAIARRLARLAELERMRADGGFALDAELGARIETLLSYVEQPDDLIPDDVPVIGQLDDAILADLLLRELGPALADYADYRAWREQRVQYAVPDAAPPELGWEAWVAARRREVEALRAQRRGCYATPGQAQGFRIG